MKKLFKYMKRYKLFMNLNNRKPLKIIRKSLFIQFY
jgi:hypothetical protein